MEDNENKALAQQLRCPSGQSGSEISEKMHETNNLMTTDTIERLQLVSSANVLEIGHGSGKHIAQLFTNKPELHYTGLDISELMHIEAKQNNHELISTEKAEFHLYNGRNIPFEPEIFDAVFTVNTVYFWDNPQDFLQQIYTILKPNGIFNLAYVQKDFMEKIPFVDYGFTLYDHSEMDALIATSNFSEATNTDLSDKPSTLVDIGATRPYSIASLTK